jgi:putative tricarboxylic transport membrane protein
MKRVLLVSLLALVATTQAWAQPVWRPERQVEIIVPTAPGGGNDTFARLMQRVLQEQRLVPTPLLVLNKSGGNQTIAANYLTQHAGDAHYLLFATSSLVTNQIQGLAQYNYAEFAPLGLAFLDFSAFMVPANSSLISMRDLLDRLKADPESVAFSVISRGGTSHAALAQAAKASGIDPKRLKIVVFKTSAEASTALMGGHIQAAVSSAAGSTPQVVAGNIRMLAIASPQRRTGALAHVPTLGEIGVPATGLTTWRGVFGAKGITSAQVAFWQDSLARAFSSEEWQARTAEHNVSAPPLRGRELVGYFEAQYAQTRSVLVDLGLAK